MDRGLIINAGVRNVTVETEDLEGRKYDGVLTRKDWAVTVQTMYKRRDKKVLLVNAPLPDGINPGGGVNGDGNLERIEERRRSVPRGSRLTPEQLAQMKLGDGLFTAQE
jgi:hypothetical protein